MRPTIHHPDPSRHAPHRWVLDIDGTMMPSHHVDNECYWRAVDDCFGGVPGPLDLQQFRHVTDGSILCEWLQQTRGRLPTASEVSKVRARFLELIEQALVRVPEAFTATEGLPKWLDRQLAANPGSVAIATGGWSHTAHFKIVAAGLDHYALPLCSCDDSHDRTGIMLRAQDRLLAEREREGVVSAAASTCYVGDGPWDYQASQQLGWAFVGIAEQGRARTLHRAGARQVFRNFSELMASSAGQPYNGNTAGNATEDVTGTALANAAGKALA
jgi:phosphoglycolate phosphatase-like HAD superfamily hydrolase